MTKKSAHDDCVLRNGENSRLSVGSTNVQKNCAGGSVFEIVLYLEELVVDTKIEIVIHILLVNASSRGVMNALLVAERACGRSFCGI